MMQERGRMKDRHRALAWLLSGFTYALGSLHAAPATAVDLIGYLPHYRMNATYNRDILPAQLAMLDEVRYFGLTIDFSGNIVPLGSGGGDLNTHLGRIATIRSAIASLPAGERPRLNITLGGAEEAANFAAVASSGVLRDNLATHVESLLDQTGAASIDIDWEHPAPGAERTTHYPALLRSLKQRVGSEHGIYATVAPSIFVPSSVLAGPNAIDGVSLMTYDLGWWGNDPSNSNRGEHSLPEYVEDAAKAWTDRPGSFNRRPWVFGSWGNAAPAEKVGVALPFYGRDIASGAATTYAQLKANGSSEDGNYYEFGGGTVWAVDPDLVADRVRFADDMGLKSIIIWEIGQDLPPQHSDSLLRAAYEAVQSLTPLLGDFDEDGQVAPADYGLWRLTFGQSGSGSLRADGDASGSIDAADYTVWRDAFRLAPAAASQSHFAVPEPSTVMLLMLAALLSQFVRERP